MSSMNNTTIIGRVIKDAQIYEKNGKATSARFTLAVRRDYKNKDGEYDSDFIEVRLVGENRAKIAKMIKQGTILSIAGSITVDKYEKDGGMVYSTYVKAESVGFTPSQPKKANTSNTSNKSKENDFMPVDEAELPFA